MQAGPPVALIIAPAATLRQVVTTLPEDIQQPSDENLAMPSGTTLALLCGVHHHEGEGC